MSFSDEDVETEESDEGNFKDLYGVRDGVLFVIDATPPMFENDPDEGTPYFLQCIRQYKEVLKQKLVWCRQDWMGLILFGTDKGDTNSGTRHILTLQKLDVVSVGDLKEIMEIDEGGKWKYYKDIASTTAYPLHDVLWEAARVFRSVTVTMPIRKVLLFTCQDNPPVTDNEKHRIRVKVQSYNDIELQLFVVGLGENWNHDVFYKDLEMLSEKIDPDDYERMSLRDIVQQIKLPSRNMAKLPLRLGENVNIDVALCNLCVKTEYLKKNNISKATSTPLTSCTYLQIASDGGEAGDEESKERASPVLEMDVQKYLTFGGKNIFLTLAEERTWCTMRERGIDLICIKPISYHPLYHFGPPHFVIPVKKSNKDKNLLFGALLHKCDARDLMIICAVSIRKHSSPILYTMIPHTRRGGFYLYKIPFKENVQKLNESNLSDYIYDDNENPPPTNANGIELFEKMINKLNIEYNPDLFSNPKLQIQQQTIETLALQLEESDPPPDTTLPNTEEVRERVKDLLEEYNEIFNEETDNSRVEPAKKKSKSAGTAGESTALEDTNKIRELAMNGQIQKFTVPQLKNILQKLCLKTSGKKEELINRIKEHYK
ncbi:X-ray repair cross-complementing protein 6 [Osmia bicornis bicornis]|uniref:X-ray repair cross-complementing protein 6 n=1 Tax=Osmia bicornis bicornis TaxID=1437191 RepID=UPI001EAEAF72|nr:X-ray repair cross-complementing protein 6 [Osmia bicornis bicornis]